MQPLHLDLLHCLRDCVPSVSCEPVNAGTHEEMCAKIVGGIKQLVDVAFPVADVNATGGLAEQHGGLAHVFQPAPALLLLDRHARGVDVPLEF